MITRANGLYCLGRSVFRAAALTCCIGRDFPLQREQKTMWLSVEAWACADCSEREVRGSVLLCVKIKERAQHVGSL